MVQSIATYQQYIPIINTAMTAPESIPTIVPTKAPVDIPPDCSSVVGGTGEAVGVAGIGVVINLVGVTVITITARKWFNITFGPLQVI